jgi:hypothetical protein
MGKLAVSVCLILGLSSCAARRPVARNLVETAPIPASPAKPLTITVYLCSVDIDTPECNAKLAQWQRKKHIEEIIPLLMDDFKNTSTVDKAERDRIAVLAEWLAKHKYE